MVNDLEKIYSPESGPSEGLADYLRGPKKKQRNFIVFAFGASFDSQVANSIESYLLTNFPKFTLYVVNNMREIKRVFNKQISLFLMDDEFIDFDQQMNLVLTIKTRRPGVNIPFLFLTREPKALIKAYHKVLLAYQEVDEYLNYKKTPLQHVTNRISALLEKRSVRKSRRYDVDLQLHYLVLKENKIFRGRLLDLSVHGAMIKNLEGKIFSENDQLRLHIPITPFLSSEEGDFLRVSAVVRRVSIGGQIAGISFEYLTEKQSFMLTKFITSFVTATESISNGLGA